MIQMPAHHRAESGGGGSGSHRHKDRKLELEFLSILTRIHDLSFNFDLIEDSQSIRKQIAEIRSILSQNDIKNENYQDLIKELKEEIRRAGKQGFNQLTMASLSKSLNIVKLNVEYQVSSRNSPEDRA